MNNLLNNIGLRSLLTKPRFAFSLAAQASTSTEGATNVASGQNTAAQASTSTEGATNAAPGQNTAAQASTSTAGATSVASGQNTACQPEKDKLFSKLEIELRGIDPAVLKSYAWFATTAANHLGIEVGNCYAPRKAVHDRLTLLKSVHIYKKHRVQYEVRTHFRYMNFHKLTGSTLDTFLEYIERNLPEGVALNATRTEIQKLPEHLRHPPNEA